MSYIFDKKTLYVSSGLSNEEQIRLIIDGFLSKISKLNKNYNNCEYDINVIYSWKTKQPIGLTYIRVEMEEVYNILCGYNPDGSERIIEKMDEKSTIVDGDDEDWFNVTETENNKTPKIIYEKLGPLYTLDKIKYNEEQIKYLQNQKDNTTEFLIEIKPARIQNPYDSRLKNVLISLNVPKDISMTILQEKFNKLSTSHEKIAVRFKNKDIFGSTPLLIRYKTNATNNLTDVLFIVFDPQTNDAAFALCMIKKCQLAYDNKITELAFDHSRDKIFLKNDKTTIHAPKPLK